MENKEQNTKILFSKFLTGFKKGTNVHECLCPRKIECSDRIIKAHSIQNNRILKKISEKGKVIQIKFEDAIFTKDCSQVGRKTATTFSGFCNFHDSSIFRSIEIKDYLPRDKEQEFLFAYRALARELNIKKTAAKIYQKGISIFGAHSYFSGLLEWTKFSIKELTKLNYFFHQGLLNKDFGKIQTKLIVLDKEYSIAVSSIFAIEYDFHGNKINDLGDKKQRLKNLFLTIFPQNGKTYILLSHLTEDSLTYNFLEEQLLSLEQIEIIKRINLLIANYCENFVLSPTKWRGLPKEEKEKFIEMFMNSTDLTRLKTPDNLRQEPKFNLFI